MDRPEAKSCLNVTDLMQELKVGRNKVLELIHGRKLRHVRIGRRIIVPRKALEEFLEREMEAQE